MGTTRITAVAEAAQAIPDDDLVGIVSALPVDAEATVGQIVVSVVIAHGYRGDLTIDLQSPSGTTVRLHDRSGGGTEDLVTTWTEADTAALGTFGGEPAGGTWSLLVADRGPGDTGVLESWTIEIAPAERRCRVTGSVAPGLAVHDLDGESTTSTIELTMPATDVEPGETGCSRTPAISSLVLDLDLTHSAVADLTVALACPSGLVVLVHDRVDRSVDNLIAQFGSAEGGMLAPFIGSPAEGVWRLTVVDHEGRDIAKLNRWSLHAEI